MNIIPIKPKLDRSSTRQTTDGQFPKVIAITSGKGGVGKTNVTSNLAIALAKQGNRVCIFDADTSLANINIVMGLTARYTIEHLLNGEKSVDEILLEGPEGVMIVPAASGIAECANLDQGQRKRLINALESLENRFDYILIDTAAGIADSVLSFVQSAQYAIVVISTEPTSLTDAFALLRVLRRRDYEHPVYVLVNMVLNYANSMEVFKRFDAAVKKYLHIKVHYLGYITEDKALKTSVCEQRPVLLLHPEALASRCFTTLATVLRKQFAGTASPHKFSAYWKDLATIAPANSGMTDSGAAPARSEPQAPAEMTPERIGSLAHDLIMDPAHDEQEIARLLQPMLELYLTRFQKFPFGHGVQLMQLLERTDYPAAEMRELVNQLGQFCEQRFGQCLDQPVSGPSSDMQTGKDEVLQQYYQAAERIQAEQALLHQALDRLYSYINREIAPDGTVSAMADDPEGTLLEPDVPDPR